LTREHAAGIEAAAEINRQQASKRLAKYEAERDARAAAHKAAEDALWAKIVERQKYVIGGSSPVR
jgi:DUF1680 family protein